MEEADILGDKIAIMKDGYMAAVGTNLRLKNKFGTGYSVTILSDPAKGQASLRQFIESVFETRARREKESIVDGADDKFTLMSEMPGVLEYKIPSRYADTMSDFFEDIEARRKEFGIHDVQLSLTTLEDVRNSFGSEQNCANLAFARSSCVWHIKKSTKNDRSRSTRKISRLHLPCSVWPWLWCSLQLSSCLACSFLFRFPSLKTP